MMVHAKTTDVNETKHTCASIMKALSDNKSLELFNIIASIDSTFGDVYSTDKRGSINTQLLISKVNLTRKQYYSRISDLISSGLVRRSNGKYKLTSLGRVAYSANALLNQAIHDHWKLKAIDALETKPSSGILDEEREKIIDMLIDNYELKGILGSKRSRYSEAEKEVYSTDIKSASAVVRHPMRMRMNQILE